MSRLSVVFTGHRVDEPGRPEARFPSARVPAVGRAIGAAVVRTAAGLDPRNVRGFASLANGGDILFHESCRRFGLRTIVVLPFAPERFVEGSVEGDASNDWMRRFATVWDATPEADRHVLADAPAGGGDAYGACNRAILDLARAFGRVHLLALWDGAAGRAGGTAEFVREVRTLGDPVTRIDPATPESDGSGRA